MGFMFVWIPLIALVTLIAILVLTMRGGCSVVIVGLILWPFIAFGVSYAVERALTFMCVYHVPSEVAGYVEHETGYCPINYYYWMDFP